MEERDDGSYGSQIYGGRRMRKGSIANYDNPWQNFLRQYRAEHPEIRDQAMLAHMASQEYQSMKDSGRKPRRRGGILKADYDYDYDMAGKGLYGGTASAWTKFRTWYRSVHGRTPTAEASEAFQAYKEGRLVIPEGAPDPPPLVSERKPRPPYKRKTKNKPSNWQRCVKAYKGMKKAQPYYSKIKGECYEDLDQTTPYVFE